jgi:CBS domain-containing protein
MKTVAEILNHKGRAVFTISPEASVLDALKIMADKEVGALLVTQDDRVVGIMSERDYARKIILHGKTSERTPVREIMTSNVVGVDSRRSAEECMALMTQGRFRHAPVIDDGKLVGMISIGDLVKAVIEEQKFVIGQLEHYITS